MSEWVKRNTGVIVANILTMLIVGVFGVWVRSSVASCLSGYERSSDAQARYDAIDNRITQANAAHAKELGLNRELFERRIALLEQAMTKNIEFQQNVLAKLASIETELKHLNSKP